MEEHGRTLTNMDEHGRTLTNMDEHGRTFFQGGFTFRCGKKWLSEIDLCVVSSLLLSCTKGFSISQDANNLSDHACVSVEFLFNPGLVHPRTLLERAENTSGHAVLMSNAYNPSLCRKAVPYHQIHPVQFVQQMQERQLPSIVGETVDSLCADFSDTIYECALNSRQPVAEDPNFPPQFSRWQRIIDCDDPKTLWRAIDWKGEFDPTPEKEKPSDAEFQQHLEQLLNPSSLDDEWPTVHDQITVPLLDDPIDVKGCEHVILKQLKPQKQAGPDGNSPGVFHLLPAQWLLYMSVLLSLVFASTYPTAWTKAKLSMLFKKGN